MFETGLFWLLAALAAVASRLVPDNAVFGRAVCFVVLSLATLHFVLGLGPLPLALVLGVLLWVIGALRIVARREGAPGYALMPVVLGPLVVLWLSVKQLNAEDLLERAIPIIGVSYLLIKGYTLAKDVFDRRQAPPPLAAGLAYFLFFPTFVAGPMHYYGEFASALAVRQRLDAARTIHFIARFLLGVVKVKVLVPLISPLSLLGYGAADAPGILQLLVASVWFSAVLLLDFSGYSDMAISSAALIGVRVPENFRFPYFARNVREFWQRWHITFTRVLTGYIFVPLTRSLQARRISREGVVAVGYLVTFLFAGYWHGATLGFLIWGLYHGLGLLVYDAYRVRTQKIDLSGGMSGRKRTITLGTVTSIGATFLFVSFGWIFFVLSADKWIPRSMYANGRLSAAAASLVMALALYAVVVLAMVADRRVRAAGT